MPGNDVKISIIIPVYNTEKYLRECLNSVVNQSLQDIEIICINDGSTDSCLAILREYEAKDARIRVIEQKNAGVSATRNIGIELARGEYIQFVDSDDTIDKTLCEKAHSLAITDKSDLVVFNMTRNIKKKNLGNFISLPSGKYDKLWLLKSGPGACTKIVRKEIYNKYDIRFPMVRFIEDVPVHWKICCLINSFSVLDECLYFYRRNPNSLCHGPTRYPFLETFFGSYFSIKQFLEEVDIEEKIFHHFVLHSFYCFWLSYMRIQNKDLGKAHSAVADFFHENDYNGFIKDVIESCPMLSKNGAIRLYLFYKMMRNSKIHAFLFRGLTELTETALKIRY